MSSDYLDADSVADSSQLGFTVPGYFERIEPTPESLEKFSPHDAKNFNRRRALVDDISDLASQVACEQMAAEGAVFSELGDFLGNSEFSKVNFFRRMKRMHECSGYLKFGKYHNTVTGDIKVRLKEARFCRVRECPMCQWRRSLVWYVRFFKNINEIEEKFDGHKFLHLTLTVPNCHIKKLRETLQGMNQAWVKYTNLTRRGCVFPEFKTFSGWVRSVEVTRERKRMDFVHPHYHVLLMVPPSYFKGESYITQKRFLEAWRVATGDESISQVHIQRVYPKNRLKDLKGVSKEGLDVGIYSAIPEVVKYGTKSDDFLFTNGSQHDVNFYKTYVEQVHHLRFIATGIGLKDILKGEDKEKHSEDVSSEEMVGRREKDIDEIEMMEQFFFWNVFKRKYLRSY